MAILADLPKFLKMLRPDRVSGLAPGRAPMRGRVQRIAITKSSEVSVVVRFGLEELDRVRSIMPGTLLQVLEVEAEVKPEKTKAAE